MAAVLKANILFTLLLCLSFSGQAQSIIQKHPFFIGATTGEVLAVVTKRTDHLPQSKRINGTKADIWENEKTQTTWAVFFSDYTLTVDSTYIIPNTQNSQEGLWQRFNYRFHDSIPLNLVPPKYWEFRHEFYNTIYIIPVFKGFLKTPPFYYVIKRSL